MIQSFVTVSFVLRYGVQGGQTFESWVVFIDRHASFCFDVVSTLFISK
jgi:hypothetical protein